MYTVTCVHTYSIKLLTRSFGMTSVSKGGLIPNASLISLILSERKSIKHEVSPSVIRNRQRVSKYNLQLLNLRDHVRDNITLVYNLV